MTKKTLVLIDLIDIRQDLLLKRRVWESVGGMLQFASTLLNRQDYFSTSELNQQMQNKRGAFHKDVDAIAAQKPLRLPLSVSRRDTRNPLETDITGLAFIVGMMNLFAGLSSSQSFRK